MQCLNGEVNNCVILRRHSFTFSKHYAELAINLNRFSWMPEMGMPGGRVDMFDVPRRDYLDIGFRVVYMTSYVQYQLSLLSLLSPKSPLLLPF